MALARRRRSAWGLASVLFALGSTACGGATEAPPAAPESGGNTVEAPSEPPPPVPEDSGTASEPAKAEPSAAEPAESDAPPEKDPNAPREIKYVLTPDGLKVEVEGARFLVNAEPKKIAAGWGVSVKVSAQAIDDGVHTLANPKNGPLAFATTVLRKGKSEPEQEGDTREGDGEITLKKGKVVEFKRDWPPKGGRILGIGDAIEIQVGLWGLGENEDSRRPVKQFAKVTMKVDQGKPRAKTEPPPNVAR